jgi:membrane peptidoglycan carboxypeptidase
MLLKLKTYFIYIKNSYLGKFILISACLVIMGLSSLNLYVDSKLPDEETIKDIELQIPLKIFSSDGKLIGEFGEQRRTALSFNDIPTHYVNAVLAAEDDNFSLIRELVMPVLSDLYTESLSLGKSKVVEALLPCRLLVII